MTELDLDIAKKLIEGTEWHHDWEIIPGLRTNGFYDPEDIWKKLEELGLPDDMSALTLADIGACNGYFSFQACRRGAQVTAFDFLHKENSGFGLAQHVNGVKEIVHNQLNVLYLKPEPHRRKFDVVLALGLLYHVADPYRALVNVAHMTKRTLFIESHVIDSSLPEDVKNEPIMRFYTNPHVNKEYSLHHDRTNFFGFTSACLHHMLEDVGLAVRARETIEYSKVGERVLICCERIPGKTTRLDVAYGTPPRQPVDGDVNDPGSWHVGSRYGGPGEP